MTSPIFRRSPSPSSPPPSDRTLRRGERLRDARVFLAEHAAEHVRAHAEAARLAEPLRRAAVAGV
jgi:hypothetical protein